MKGPDLIPELTFELKICLPVGNAKPDLKQQVCDWLVGHDVSGFVEGAVDDIDIDHCYENPSRDFYGELGGQKAALSVYSYDRPYLRDLESGLQNQFPDLSFEHLQMDSKIWMEGWKESFKPIRTQLFEIYPPWEKPGGQATHPIEIEPGMAFGTGQHATTQLCLEALETFDFSELENVLDVGTGTGVLAIAAAKMGSKNILATDIEVDAVHAAKENARINAVDYEARRGSVPPCPDGGRYQLVIANILYVVLTSILEDLAQALASKGRMVLSGILPEQAPDMIGQAKSLGLKLISSQEKDGWVCLVLTKD